MKTRVKLKKSYQNRWVGINEQAISKHLKQLGMIEKEGYWVSHELKPRGDVERRLFACEQLVERQTRKAFLHRMVNGDDSCQKRHDNARPPHVAKVVVKTYLQTLKWEILPHPPPYSPDVAPSADFHLIHIAQWHTAWLTSTWASTKK
nr:Mariner Mos1 transposase [Hymenolepis microstoma]